MLPAIRMIRAVLLAFALSALGACSALTGLGDVSTPLAVFVLEPPQDLPRRQGAPQRRAIIIEEPTTDGALATERIMIQPDALRAEYLPGVRWTDPAPVLLQTLMVRALDTTGAFEYVGRRPLGPGGDYAIVTELVDFHAALLPDGESARIEVQMVSRIVREEGVQIVATRTFTATAISNSLSDADLVTAFNAAAGSVIAEFTGWILSTLGAI
jgi:cholesterol transport system auxiliary component